MSKPEVKGCPTCGSFMATTERRPNGNSKCVNGHTHPTKDFYEQPRLTDAAAQFVKENDNSPVVSASVKHGGGMTGRLKNGRVFDLSLDDSRSLPEGYPKWDI